MPAKLQGEDGDESTSEPVNGPSISNAPIDKRKARSVKKGQKPERQERNACAGNRNQQTLSFGQSSSRFLPTSQGSGQRDLIK